MLVLVHMLLSFWLVTSARFQGDWDQVEYPHVKGSKPRDPFRLLSDFKMEELGDLLWIGGIAAKHASPQFQEAWGHLRYAAEHYLYGFTSDEPEQKKARERLFQYGELIEQAVKAGEVRLRFCRLLDWGPQWG